MHTIAMLLLAAAPLTSPTPTKGLDVYWVDVEGGTATLLVTPEGESVLIDTGMPGERDPGRIYHVAAEVAGLSRIDHLIVTHFHMDHFGGAADLAAKIPIGRIYDNGIPNLPESDRDRARIDGYAQAFKPEQRVRLEPGFVVPLRAGSSVKIRCLGTRQEFVAVSGDVKNAACEKTTARPTDTSENAQSAVLLLEMGPFRLYLGGDLTWNLEAALVCPTDRVGKVDVYQVDHHGLDLSNNPVLVQTLQPTVAVMNSGARKGAEPGTLATLRAAGAVIYQLHRNVRGGDEVNTDAQRIANLDETCKASEVHLSVAPDGTSYTVAIPATGHKQTFRTRGAESPAVKPSAATPQPQ